MESRISRPRSAKPWETPAVRPPNVGGTTLSFTRPRAAGATLAALVALSTFGARRSHAQAATDSAVVLAAGDIATCQRGARETGRILDETPGRILVPGDVAYASRRHKNPYRDCYEPAWGRFKDRTYPVPGNHDAEYIDMYFDYFGPLAGPRPEGYYSFDVGAWHILALNSTVAMGPLSAQGRWVREDLAAHPTKCTLAFMHHPRFSSGQRQPIRAIMPMWELMDSAGIDVVIAGHDHFYERFAPMRADGLRDDSAGIRQFIVGTGGAARVRIRSISANSAQRTDETFGVLKLVLWPDRYSWEFIPTARSRFRDTGSGTCH